jgi:hypothetical protein
MNNARLIELIKKARAGAPPRPHDDRTSEHNEQCVECQKWNRAMHASVERLGEEEGMIKGELNGILTMTWATKANALAGPPPAGHAHIASGEERKQCPECQEWDKALAAAYEKLKNVPPEELLAGEQAFDPEYFTKMKAAMLPAMDALKEAIESGDLRNPPEHLRTHKSSLKESLACDICQGWTKRYKEIFEETVRPRSSDST